MIIDSFDIESEAIISPEHFFGEKHSICDIAIGTFSREIYATVLERFSCEKIGEIIHKASCINVGRRRCAVVRPCHMLYGLHKEIAIVISTIAIPSLECSTGLTQAKQQHIAKQCASANAPGSYRK